MQSFQQYFITLRSESFDKYMAKLSNIKIRLTCSYGEWWRYNVYVSAVCFDADGNVVEYKNLTDKVYELGSGAELRTAPEDYDPSRPIALECGPCLRAELFLYIIPNTMPAGEAIRTAPPFTVHLHITKNSSTEVKEFEINQWGGASLRLPIE